MEKASSPSRRNVIWIFGDQHRGQMLGCNGDPNVATPNLDRLSNTGVHFQNAVSGAPVCIPFRGSLLTSRYPHECFQPDGLQLNTEIPTVAHAFREHGYDTAYFGKWHLDGATKDRQKHLVPSERRGGFDKWIGYENNNSQWDCWVHGTGIDTPERLNGYETDALTDLFIGHLKEKAATDHPPFFAVLSVQPPHTPYVAPEEWMRRHSPGRVELRPNVPRTRSIEPVARRELAGAHAMVENLDWNVGRIMAELERSGLADNTYIVFFSDHGDMHGSHGAFRKSVPWEESIRVPFIVGGAGAMARRPGPRPDPVVNHVDIAPTTLGLCGIDKPEAMRGFDYSGWVRGDRPSGEPPESAYLQIISRSQKDGKPTDGGWRAVVSRDGWKYACVEHQPWMLFDLNDDPYELANHARGGKYKVQRRRLHELLRNWMEETGDTFTLPDL